MQISIKDKLLSNINKSRSGCWEWTKSLYRDGYGRIYNPDTKKSERAHRISYTVFVGSIPEKLMVCHKCDNPKCINPDHLFLGTNQENIQDSVRKGRWNHGKRFKKGESNENNRGTKHHCSKLTEDDVRFIRKNYKPRDSEFGQKALAKMFNIDKSVISRIINRKVWGWLDAN